MILTYRFRLWVTISKEITWLRITTRVRGHRMGVMPGF